MPPAFQADRRGHSSRKLLSRDKELTKLPTPFSAIPTEVMLSPAFMTLGIHAWRLLAALIVEHFAHNRLENGRLVVTYDQLVQLGISRRKIPGAIAEVETHGLVRRTAIGSGNRRTGDRQPSLYRLTFFGSLPDRMGPTNEWRAYTAPERPQKNTSASSTTERRRGPHGGPSRVSYGGT